MSLSCLCGNEASTVIWRDPVYSLFRCVHCSLMRVEPVPNQSQLDALYSPFYFEKFYRQFEKPRLIYFHRWLDYLSNFRKPGRLLDVGCGIGLFIEAAIEHGWEAYGIEPSSGIEHARKNGVSIGRSTLENAVLPFDRFDLITFWDVLAHVRNPLEQLVKARELLVDDGVVLIKTPNRAFFDVMIARALNPMHGGRGWLHIPAQLFHFSQQSLTEILSQAGFRVLATRLSDEPVRFDDRAVVRKPKVFAAQLLRSLLRMLGHRESIVTLAVPR